MKEMVKKSLFFFVFTIFVVSGIYSVSATDCNGSDVDLTSNVSNCGACGNVCTAGANVASVVCSSSTCRVNACNADYYDCNGVFGDGCEMAAASLLTSVTNCGTCGTVCSSSHGTRSCSAGLCQISCDNGWANFDGNAQSNGCETNTSFFSSSSDCFKYKANYAGCAAYNSSCIWWNNSGAVPSNTYCEFNSTNFNSSQSYNSPFGGVYTRFNFTNNNIINAGCCEMKSGSGGNGTGPRDCWSFDRNETGCANANNSGIYGCTWKVNNQNQNPMCNNNIGCCMRQSCGDLGGTQNATNNCSSAFSGVCSYKNITQNSYCPNPNGCCEPKACTEVTTETKCLQLSQFGMSCNWNGTACKIGTCDMVNDSQTCLNRGDVFGILPDVLLILVLGEVVGEAGVCLLQKQNVGLQIISKLLV